MAERLKFLVFTGILVFLNLFLCEIDAQKYDEDKVLHLQPGDTYGCCTTNRERAELKIMCYSGQKPHLLSMFQSAFLEINITTDKFDVYKGGSVDEVAQQYAKDLSLWSIVPWGGHRSREVQLRPFNQTCVGMDTRQDYQLRLVLLRVSYYRLIVLAAGVALFFAAPKLGRNTAFHYLSGISFGVVASCVILTVIIMRMFPKKPIVWTVLGGGWMVLVYLGNLAWDNMRHIALEYQTHIAGYLAISALISFLVCYRAGPVTSPRTMDIIQWGLQLVGIVMVLMCSHYQEATIGLTILMLSVHNFPASWSSKIAVVWSRCFPPKRKLISMAEYEDEGVRETEKALSELRSFCSTPQSNPWKLSLKLKDPARFARFMQGESHLSDDELMEYNVIKCQADELLTDDDDEDY